MSLCAISIDLDEIAHYHRIHGLAEPEGAATRAVYERALSRALDFAMEEDLPLSLFSVASDLLEADNASRLRVALSRGHEIGSHSRDHLYDLSRRSAAEQRAQVSGALDLFERVLGIRPAGFRAPGYVVTDELLRAVALAGHRYDSSVFPCPPYYAAKATAFAALRLRRRRSSAILDRPSVLRAPTRPYRIGKPYHRVGDGLVELPIQVTRGLRLPYIGTALIVAGELGARALTELVVGEPFINLELHAIDWLDLDDGLALLRGHQPDVAVPIGEKRHIFQTVVKRLRRAGYRFVRLGEGVGLA